ncbi:MAG: 4Fe-4S ferredoxin [bacterium]|nr:4Fe-4S ferredoxin [bacterium]
MAVRKIVHIDEDLCDGCGDCVPSCAEGAIQIIGGKAVLLADNLCDGLGACLGECPQGAITIEERDADDFDEEAVHDHVTHMPDMGPVDLGALMGGRLTAAPLPGPGHGHGHGHGHGGCPGSRMQHFPVAPAAVPAAPAAAPTPTAAPAPAASELRQWPIQLHLVNPTAPYFMGAHLLLAADCCAFATAEFHQRFLRGKALAMACPKLDQGREIYRQKLTAMVDQARLDTITVMIMEVPCCNGLLGLAQEAVAAAGRKVPIKLVVLGVQGQVVREDWC